MAWWAWLIIIAIAAIAFLVWCCLRVVAVYDAAMLNRYREGRQ
jgi:hypothetical protein